MKIMIARKKYRSANSHGDRIRLSMAVADQNDGQPLWKSESAKRIKDNHGSRTHKL